MQCAIGDLLTSPDIPPSFPEDEMSQKEPPVILKGIWGYISQKLGIPAWGQILCAVVILGCVILGHIELSLNSIGTKIELLPATIAKQLISDAERYALAGKNKTALDAVTNATSFVRIASEKRLPAKPQYFSETLKQINAVPSKDALLKDALFDARLALAEYRSTIETKPWTPLFYRRVDHFIVMGGGHDQTVENFAIDASSIKGDVFYIQQPSPATLAQALTVKDTTVANGSQKLDGFHWQNIYFENMHISYAGGDTELRNVHFINCTFDFPRTDNSVKLMEYAALLPDNALVVN